MFRCSLLLLMLATTGCAPVSAPAASPEPRAATFSPVAETVPALDDAAAVAQARRFFDAVDGRNREVFVGLVSEGFFLFEAGAAVTADMLSKNWKPPVAGAPRRTRTCEHGTVRRSASIVTYVGDCLEQQPAMGKRSAQQWQGWNTVVMAHEDGAWKVVLWEWQKSGIEAERDRYNEAYRRKSAYVAQPNRLLVDTVGEVEPGAALVVAMGQGRNALHLAARGWRVTGIDIADEGLRMAKRSAEERGLKLDMVLADIDRYDFGTARWDLVTMIYAGGDEDWIRRIKKSIVPGGLFILEFGLKDPTDDSTDPFAGIAAGELAPQFDGWQIVRDEVVQDIADWGKSTTPLVRFVARKPGG
jgi:SAM-dependent methyltransferase